MTDLQLLGAMCVAGAVVGTVIGLLLRSYAHTSVTKDATIGVDQIREARRRELRLIQREREVFDAIHAPRAPGTQHRRIS